MSGTGVESEKPRDGEYHIALPSFEGPLDLLLHLIQKHELEILDIPVSFITEKYLEYLSLMQVLAIDIASEYLVMAATLTHLKSKSLLPAEKTVGQEEEDPDEDEIDSREELIRRLLEYQKYKQAAADLNDRGALGRDVFLRGLKVEEAEGPAPLARVEVWNLLDAFAKVLAKTKVKIDHEVSFDRLSITERIQELCTSLAGKSSVRFEELFEGERTRFDLVITFLALLEMTRLKLTRVYQADPLSEIFIELTSQDGMAQAAAVVDPSLIAAAPDESAAAPEVSAAVPEESAAVPEESAAVPEESAAVPEQATPEETPEVGVDDGDVQVASPETVDLGFHDSEFDAEVPAPNADDSPAANGADGDPVSVEPEPSPTPLTGDRDE